MHPLLSKLLVKRGIKDTQDMTPEETADFQRFDAVLSKRELTMDDIKKFLTGQIDLIEAKWRDYAITQEKKAQYIPYHTVYKSLLAAINSPQAEAEAMERTLIQLTQ